jgi:hypothetical protein
MPLAYGNLEGLSATLNLLGEAVNGLSLRLLPVSSPPDEPFSEKPDKDRIPMSDISNRILDAQEQAHRILENVQAIEHRLEV